MDKECKSSIGVDATNVLEDSWMYMENKLREARFFIDSNEQLFNIINNVKECTISEKESYYRARENKNGTKFSKEDLMPPGPDICTAGRVNPKGISYMYIADSAITSISEIRPWIGAKVQVCECKPIKTLILKDFTIDNSESEELILKYNKLLSKMFSKPVSIYDKDKEYLITQCVAEYLRKRAKREDLTIGYDGIKYTSSANSNGFDIVIFNSDNIKITNLSKIVTVKDIIVKCSEIKGF